MKLQPQYNMAITSKQKRFCELYVLGGNATRAYQEAYDNDNVGTCKARASTMLKKADINDYIKELQGIAKKIHGKKVSKSIDAIEDSTEHQALPLKERIHILSLIARGEIPLTKPIVVSGEIQHVAVVPDWMDRKNAIAELNKMDGTYAPTKTAQTDVAGNDIAQVDLTKLTDNELRKLAELQHKSRVSKT